MSITMPGPHPLVGMAITYCGRPARVLAVLGHGRAARLRIIIVGDGDIERMVVPWDDPRIEPACGGRMDVQG